MPANHRRGRTGLRSTARRSIRPPAGSCTTSGCCGAGHRAVAVHDVTADEDEDGVALRRQPLPRAREWSATIDGARRLDFRQQHSGQHLLSASFDHLFDVRTESVHLGLDVCTLDLHREVSPDECRRAEDDANAVVWDDRPVSIRYADAADLASEPRLRKATGRARHAFGSLISQDHDLSACGGTHVQRTGEIGVIVIRGGGAVPRWHTRHVPVRTTSAGKSSKPARQRRRGGAHALGCGCRHSRRGGEGARGPQAGAASREGTGWSGSRAPRSLRWSRQVPLRAC